MFMCSGVRVAKLLVRQRRTIEHSMTNGTHFLLDLFHFSGVGSKKREELHTV